jgi:hypothetical protein
MRVGEATCDNCGRATHLDYLDAKPVMTNWLRVVQFFLGQDRMLQYAADHGYDFDRMECRDCYGPAHVEIAIDFTGLDELRKPVDEVRE